MKRQLRITNYELRIQRTRGFSLVELIVVITIIIIVSAVAATSFAGSGKKARDSRRTADLEKVRMALELARQTGTTYPATLTGLETGNFLSKVPTDPKSGTYRYTVTNNSFSYSLEAQMEDIATTNCLNCTNGYNYRVVNP